MWLAGISTAQISPGELSKAHANLEGISNCTKCHDLGKSVSEDKCLECHKVIAGSIKLNKGFHAQKEVKEKKCFSCHGEHFGRDFQLVRFDRNKFDHTKTGFALKGKHSEIKCEECHRKEFIKSGELKKRSSTFLGLDRTCTNCHEDIHRKTLGENCADCHTFKSFKPAGRFDHDKTSFKLTGKHGKVDCEKCHSIERKDGKNFQHFAIGKKKDCSDCHTDIHKGRFEKSCEKCHSTDSFTKIKNLNKFDHSKTRFPLLGKHDNVECSKCHGNNLNSKPAHNKCTDCHKDYHNGQFTVDGKLRDCSECHNVNGFSPSDFTLELHAKTAFKLTGAHLAIPCFNCHNKGKELNFRFATLNCETCHKNIHGKNISTESSLSEGCISCHTTDKWSVIIYKHKTKNFPLLGKHLEVSCRNCHFENETSLFYLPGTGCLNCHKDVHNNQFSNGGKDYCSRCHGFNSWKPELFDHNKTGFKLDGAHSKVECSKCHKEINSNGITFINYKFKEVKCTVCHH